MARHKPKESVSDFYAEAKINNRPVHNELMVREAFLRMAKEEFDGAGIESWTVDHVRGALLLLEKFVEVKEEQ